MASETTKQQQQQPPEHNFVEITQEYGGDLQRGSGEFSFSVFSDGCLEGPNRQSWWRKGREGW